MKFKSPLVSAHVSTPLGGMLLAASPLGLAGAWFQGQRHAPDPSDWTHLPSASGHAVLATAQKQLHEYFSGERQLFEVPLDLGHGTPFQQQVWRALLAIPPGHTTTYGGLATQLQRPTASRAVGGAVGRNPISILVPCHRVLGTNGAMTGYAGGLDKKLALLRTEGLL